MKKLILNLRVTTLTVFLILTLIMFGNAKANSITEGQAAPDFKLLDQTGTERTLHDYAGKWLVLYFYPKNDTPGCTKEACSFRDEYKVIVEQNTQVLGVSIDNQDSHAEFAEKYGLPFPLLADTTGKVAKSYQALNTLGPLKFAKRHTFIIDPNGNIQKIFRKVNVDIHSQEVIQALRELQTL